MFVIDALIYLAPTILVAVAALLIYFFLSEVNKHLIWSIAIAPSTISLPSAKIRYLQ
jgi:hypothetical protein